MEYGLIGAKLGHSYSKKIHEMLPTGYTYDLHALPTEAEFHAFMREKAFRAINVTIPYKQMVIPYCDEIDPLAREIGAVNTIVNKNGRLSGYNTDYDGFAQMLARHEISLRGKTVLILGTGGTHNTVEAVCRNGGAVTIYTASRTGRNGALTYAEAAAHPEIEIVINTTPAGMYPNVGGCLLDLDSLPNLEAVADVVYNPFKTELLLRAEDRGIPAVGGFEMLVGQAVFAAERFTGQTLDRDRWIRSIHRQLKRQISNVSLVGMPGSGKSTIGRILARRLGKQFVDIDTVIRQRAGCSIPDIFANEGEARFREYEAAALADKAKESGQVIACGGGAVKDPANPRALRQNGPVLWLRRPLDQLATGGRPLSKSPEALAQMEKERTPLYRAAADAIIENTGTLQETVSAAEAAFNRLL